MNYQNENFSGEYELRCGRHRGYHVSVHLHEYSEVLFCKKGEAELTVNGKPYILKENHLIFIGPNQLHSYDCDAYVYCAVFSSDLVPLFFKKLGKRTIIPTPIDFSDSLYLPEMLPRLNGAEPTLISGYLNLICAAVLEKSPTSEEKSKDGILYQKVINYLSEHYTENITLKSVAAQFGYSEKYLSGNLHTLTGINFRKLLSLYRVNHAKRMLHSKRNYSISSIAMNSGFSSLNTFNRAFKEIVGVTPTQYKK